MGETTNLMIFKLMWNSDINVKEESNFLTYIIYSEFSFLFDFNKFNSPVYYSRNIF